MSYALRKEQIIQDAEEEGSDGDMPPLSSDGDSDVPPLQSNSEDDSGSEDEGPPTVPLSGSKAAPPPAAGGDGAAGAPPRRCCCVLGWPGVACCA